MKKEEQSNKAKRPGNEEYDVNHPQNITQPSFRSDSSRRDSGDKPATENLNFQDEENDATFPKKDHHLPDDIPKPDLGNGEKKDDKDDEKLIRE